MKLSKQTSNSTLDGKLS